MSQNTNSMEKLDSITIEGNIVEKDNEHTTLESPEGLFIISNADIKDCTEVTTSTSRLRIAHDAKIVFQTLMRPGQAKGIIAREKVLSLLQRQSTVECSRCIDGPCECSRCVDAGLSGYECSRCIDGPCECSRCVDAGLSGYECSRCIDGPCECSRCVDAGLSGYECSRCIDGPCECSRCVDAGLSGYECSRCIDGPCECSRCIDSLQTNVGARLSRFRRRIR